MGQALLVDGTPEIMLLAANPRKDFVNVEGIAIPLVLSFQAARVDRSELYAPQPNRFPTDCNPTLSQQIFNMPVAKIEPLVKPIGIADDIWWESVPFVGIHGPSRPI